MAATQKDPVLVVVQLSGGNDYLNTVIPYNNALYRDNRKAVSIGDNQIMQLDRTYGIPSYLAPMKQFWDDGNLAIMHGVGYLDSPRSHFRSMDIWHTCEPDKVGTEGWLGRVVREFDPEERQRGHRRQLRPVHVPRIVRAGRSGGVRGRPARAIRLPAGHPGPAAAPGDARSLLADVPAGAGQRRHGISRHHGSRLAQRRRHPQGCAGALQVRREVSRTRRSPASSRGSPRCTSPISAHGSSIAIRQLRHACGPEPAAREPLDRADPGPRGVHGRPQGA